MDITTLAAWGEFLGGIAVIFSLIYVATQIRQGSKLLRVSTTASTHELRLSPQTLISQDSKLAEIWWKGIDDFASLSEVERRQFNPLAHMYFFVDNQSYQFLQEGIISPLAWDNVDRELRWKLAQPGLRLWWREWHRLFPQVFIDYAESVIREREADE